jgi:hypothetical protein
MRDGAVAIAPTLRHFGSGAHPLRKSIVRLYSGGFTSCGGSHVRSKSQSDMDVSFTARPLVWSGRAPGTTVRYVTLVSQLFVFAAAGVVLVYGMLLIR